MDIDDSRLYNDKEMKAFEKLYEKLINLGEQIDEITIGNSKENKTVLFIVKARNYLEIYKTEVPEQLKEKQKVYIESLENKLKILEGYLEALSKNDKTK